MKDKREANLQQIGREEQRLDDSRLERVARFIHVGEFASFEDWVAHAKNWIGGTGAICVDAKGRRCAIGRDMMRARDEGAFPVTYVYVADPDEPATDDAGDEEDDDHDD